MSPDRVWLIPLLPLVGFALAGAVGRRLGKPLVSALCCGTIVLAFVLSALLFLGRTGHEAAAAVVAYDWIAAGKLTIPVAFLVDPLSLTMLLVVTGVGALIHVYSIGYMWSDEGYWRYFAYLNLFVFFMLVLVLADSLPLMFVGWEGVGLCSYLLIGYYYRKPSAADAGLKAFLVNRVGDFGFMVAMLTAFATFGTLSFAAIAAAAPDVVASGGSRPLELMTFMLFLAATGKSAQIPLYVWLPDAMEGPSPVSALIHAATMVTSGIYMIARTFAVFSLVPEVLLVVAVVGAVTAAFAATMGLVASDIKRVLAYSTISQLGYMFLALGVGAVTAGMFHLVTHAFFKACLFLGAGAVMHALHDETDLAKMGGLRRKIKITWLTMLAATLAIVGFPLASGFVSKDAILVSAYLRVGDDPLYGLVFALGWLTVGLTAFYMFRLYFLAFHGQPRMSGEDFEHAHDASRSMAIALVGLGLASLVGGGLNWPAGLGGSERFSHFLAPVVAHGAEAAEHHLSLGQELGLSAGIAFPAVIGFLLAFAWYGRPSEAPRRWAERWRAGYQLLKRKWYVDELYGLVAVGSVLRLSRFLREWIDEIVIDGTINLFGLGTQVVGEVVRTFQSGYLRNYALFLALGATVVLVWAVL